MKVIICYRILTAHKRTVLERSVVRSAERGDQNKTVTFPNNDYTPNFDIEPDHRELAQPDGSRRIVRTPMSEIAVPCSSLGRTRRYRIRRTHRRLARPRGMSTVSGIDDAPAVREDRRALRTTAANLALSADL